LPGPATLRWDDLTAPSGAERSVPAQRLALADTLSQTTSSDAPVVRERKPSVSPALRRFVYASVLAAAVGLGAWALLSPPRPKPPSTTPLDPAAKPVLASAPSPAETAARALRRYALDIDPPEAVVAVDGKPASVVHGQAIIEGEVGSVKRVAASFAGRSAEQRVAITMEALVPSRLSVPRDKPRGPLPRPSDSTSTASPTPPVPSMAAELSQKFE
jgi:hypothetical protein